jgi:hypothetical protein
MGKLRPGRLPAGVISYSKWRISVESSARLPGRPQRRSRQELETEIEHARLRLVAAEGDWEEARRRLERFMYLLRKRQPLRVDPTRRTDGPVHIRELLGELWFGLLVAWETSGTPQ